MPSVPQRSFAGGEVSRAVQTHVDLAKHQTQLKKLRNMFVMKHGGATNRPGTKFVAEVKDSSKLTRLIPFEFSIDQTYVLEFGDLYMRAHKYGAPVYAAYPTPYEIVTPYTEAELRDLQFVQSADIITIVHPSHAPAELARTADDNWTLTSINFGISFSAPTNVIAAKGASGSLSHRYIVTAVSADDYEESLYNQEKTRTGMTLTLSTPCYIGGAASSDFDYANGDEVYVRKALSFPTQTAGPFILSAVAGPPGITFNILNPDGSNTTPATFGGSATQNSTCQVVRPQARINAAAQGTAATPNQVKFTAVTGALEYNVYKYQNGSYGFLGSVQQPEAATSSTTVTFMDVGLSPDMSDPPPVQRSVFNEAGKYPSTVAYYQQRLLFAASNNEPEKIWASQTGRFHNFTIHSPLRDDDSGTWTMAGSKVAQVKHLADLESLVILTNASEHAAGSKDNPITPANFSVDRISGDGASSLKPLIVKTSLVFVQNSGSQVLELAPADGEKENDLSAFVDHLLDGYELVDWCYQQSPHSIIWMVRDDGKLLGLTFVKKQAIIGWHQHDTDGQVESVTAVREGSEDALYLVVKRTINGATKRYVERMATRRVSNVVDAFFVDCGITYDGWNLDPIAPMVLEEGTTWTAGETVKIVSGAAAMGWPSSFTEDDAGNQIHFRTSSGEIIRIEITSVDPSLEFAMGIAQSDIPVELRESQWLDWAKAVHEVSGLSHLEGKAVSVLGDGFVVSNANADSDPIVVTAGKAELGACYAKVHIGLPYTSDLVTLDVNTAQGQPLNGKKKCISGAVVDLEKTGSLWAGSELPDDDSLAGLVEMKVQDSDDGPAELISEERRIPVNQQWNSSGQVALRQSEPLPLTVLALIIEGLIPFKG